MLKSFSIAAAALCVCTLNPFANAQAESGADAASINAMCPIGKEPVVASAGTIEYKGQILGFCCPGCDKQFMAWDEQRRDEFVRVSLAAQSTSTAGAPDQRSAHGEVADGPSYPYTLDTCPVSGEKLGSMGKPIVRKYDGREVRFCCGGCVGKFEAEQAKYWGEIDKRIVEQQLMHYPIETCIVTGDKLGDDTINHVHNNRLVRLANAEAAVAFKTDPVKHLEALDKKIVEVQLPDYPMDTCPVGGPLGSMGEPVNFIYMNRLVRFCCGGCEDKLVNDPAKYMGELNAAYANQQRNGYALDTCVVSGAPLGSMGEPVELVAGTELVRFCCDGCLPEFKQNPSEFLSKLPKD